MSKKVRAVQVLFPRAKRYLELNPGMTPETHTYILPEGVSVEAGDELLVPTTIRGTDREIKQIVEVYSVGELEYKYAIGKIERFEDLG